MILLSVKEYAARRSISIQAVTWQIRNNKLPTGDKAQKVGSFWVIIPKQ